MPEKLGHRTARPANCWWRAGRCRQLPCRTRRLHAGHADAVTFLEVEKANRMDLVPGDTAQRVRSGAGLGKVRKPAKPLTEQRCRAVSPDGRTIGEKVFEHDHVSLLLETGSCHAGKREKSCCAGRRDSGPRIRSSATRPRPQTGQ